MIINYWYPCPTGCYTHTAGYSRHNLLLSELHASCLAKAKQADIACTFCHNIWTTKLMTMEDTATISLETGKTEGTNVFPPSLHA